MRFDWRRRAWLGTTAAGLAAVLAALAGGGLATLASGGTVRQPAIAGSWYPADPALVRTEIHRMLRAADGAPSVPGRPVALVVPHAGWSYSGVAAASAFRLLGRGEFDRVVVVAPSHHSGFNGYVVDADEAYLTPLGRIPIDAKGLAALREEKMVKLDPSVGLQEHAVEIELPFLQETLGDFRLVPVLTGVTTPDQERAMAMRLRTLDDGRTLFVFSSDFTHYGPRFDYMPFGATAQALGRIRDMDRRGIDRLENVDAEGFRAYLADTSNTICGRAGLRLMMELLPLVAPESRGTLLARYSSGEMETVRDDSSVSYVAMAFPRGKPAPAGAAMTAPPTYEPVAEGSRPLSEREGKLLVDLARATLRTRLAEKEDLSRALERFPEGPEYERLQGVFVTLSRTRPDEIASHGRLRGCIGQITPRLPLYEAVVYAAVGAALYDRRFEPVRADELDGLEVEVTVLSPRTLIPSPSEIRLGTHGIILDKEDHHAVFLPQVPTEEGWTLEETLSALSRKAGLAGDAWREGAQLSVFTGQVFHEKEPS